MTITVIHDDDHATTIGRGWLDNRINLIEDRACDMMKLALADLEAGKLEDAIKQLGTTLTSTFKEIRRMADEIFTP